jgi:hypothetical protein
VRADPVQNSAALDGDVRSPVARRNGDDQEASGRVGVARYRQGLDTHGLVYSFPGRLYCLLLDDHQRMLMQGGGAVGVVGTDSDDQDAPADIGQCDQIISKVVNVIELSFEVKMTGLAGAFTD